MPTTEVFPLETSPESVRVPGLAYSSVSSTPEIAAQRPGRTSSESNRRPSRPCRPNRPPPLETTMRPFARVYGGTTTHESRTSAPIEGAHRRFQGRSEEHTSELQSRLHLVCRLLLEKKKKKTYRKRCRD